MDAKTYLGQAYRIDQRINSKIEQIISLREFATKATATLSDMPHSATSNVHSMEQTIAKMVGLESEINSDIDELVALKSDIVHLISRIKNTEHHTLLELRYLCFKSWEQIAVEMKYSVQHIYRLHNKSLEEFNVLLNDESKCY